MTSSIDSTDSTQATEYHLFRGKNNSQPWDDGAGRIIAKCKKVEKKLNDGIDIDGEAVLQNFNNHKFDTITFFEDNPRFRTIFIADERLRYLVEVKKETYSEVEITYVNFLIKGNEKIKERNEKSNTLDVVGTKLFKIKLENGKSYTVLVYNTKKSDNYELVSLYAPKKSWKDQVYG